jgi:hydroxyacylglutathione hydrolase
MKYYFLIFMASLLAIAAHAQSNASDVSKSILDTNTIVHTLKLGAANAYLIKAGSNILVDAGSKSNYKKLVKQLQQLNCPVAELDYIFITHAHWDHCGNVAQLKKLNPALKIIMQQGDTVNVQQAKNAVIKPFRWHTKLYVALFKKPYSGFTPDIIFQDSFSLKSIGINAYLLHTPGHTPGSASLVSNDGKAIIGDLLMGSPVHPKKTIYHLFVDDYTYLTHSPQGITNGNINTHIKKNNAMPLG